MKSLNRSGRRYALLDIETTKATPPLGLSSHMSGVAVLVRRKGRPVDFWMEELPKEVCTPEDLMRRIGDKSGLQTLKACIRDELRPPVRSTRLPSLTVAVCTRDRPKRLARCLKSLLSMETSAFGLSVSMEILVIDNAPSTSETSTLADSLPGVSYFLESRPGLDFARNRALKEAGGDLLAYVDDDVIADSGWLAGLMEAWMEHPDAAAFTGQVLPYQLSTKAQILFEKRGGFRRGFNTIRYAQKLDGHPAYPFSAGVFGTGANMAFRTRILKRLNGFDEALDTGPPLPAAGDHDIFCRLIRGGYSIVYKPEFLVFHEHRRELKALLRQYWSWGLGVMALAGKWQQTDPTQCRKLRYLIRAWFSSHLRELAGCFIGKGPIPVYMVLAEIAGGIAGLMGGYARSVRRIERIREQFPCAPKAQSRKQ